MTDHDRPSVVAVVAAWLSYLWLIALIVGGYGAAFGWRPGAYLMLTALVGYLAGHLVVGLTEYRRVMGRPWPRVPPLDDDEDW